MDDHLSKCMPVVVIDHSKFRPDVLGSIRKLGPLSCE